MLLVAHKVPVNDSGQSHTTDLTWAIIPFAGNTPVDAILASGYLILASNPDRISVGKLKHFGGVDQYG